MRNNNSAIVRKITRRTLGVNKKRNFFIMFAIVLTAFMLTSVFSVGISLYESISMFRYRLEGTRAHIGIDNPSPEQLETLENIRYVRHINHIQRLGTAYIPAFESGIILVNVCQTGWREFLTPTYTNVRGRLAQAENEIMMSRAKLTAMGINSPYIGMEIPMSFSIYGSDDIFEKTFILSAMYTEFVSAQPGQAFTPIFVSEAFAQTHGAGGYRGVNIIFRTNARAYDYARRLLEELPLLPGQEYGLHPALMHAAEINATTMYVTMGIAIAFLMLTGFLLIYNVMYVSVSKDVRFYGMLKTLGTTPRQLRRIVNGQVLWLSVIGLPIGMLVAATASFLVVPAFVAGGIPTGAIVSFSPFIFAGGAVFTLLTVYLGAFTSARKAARVSPIESTKYIGEHNIKAHRIGWRGKPWRMAWRNVFRERKRALVVMFSLFLGIAVFGLIMSMVSSIDIDNYIETWHTHDFAVSGGPDFLDQDFIDQVGAIPGVTEIHQNLQTFAFYYAQDASSTVYGIDTQWLLTIDPTLAYTLDIEAFERGEIALAQDFALQFRNNPLYLTVGHELEIEIGGTRTPSNVTIAGNIRMVRPPTSIGWSTGIGALMAMSDLVMSSVYLRQYHNVNIAGHIGINVLPGADSQVNTTLQSMLVAGNSAMVSRYEARRQMEEQRFLLAVLGIGISTILGLIGVLNFVNTLSVGLIVRKREFAAMESVGMTKKQLRKMLRLEGAIYWVTILALSMTIGTAIAYWVLDLLVSDPYATNFPQFIYPWIPITIAYIFIVAICTIAPAVAYRSINKLPIAERLREAE